ncbi:MAG: TPM domain-containing protein [Ignavibacteria bacterium]|nr:TPM domain-containing protein [Ignavibacteria bacterium]
MIKKNFIHQILSEVELEKISDEIKAQEKRTSGELKVSIKKGRNFFERKKSIREIAIREFHRLGMINTKDRSGILFLLLLKDREFYILPDVGITEKLPQDFWNELAKLTEEYFRNKDFFGGIIHVIRKCGDVLSEHFPRKSDDVDELSNKVEIG